MTQPASKTQPSLLVRFFSGCAILSCGIQWTWTLLILSYPFFTSDVGKFFTPPEVSTNDSVSFAIHLPSPVESAFAIVTVVAALLLCGLALLWVPREISRVTTKTSRKTAEALVPIVSRHQKLTPKKRRYLSDRILWWIRFTAIVLPFLLLLVSPLFTTPLEGNVTLIFGSFLFVGTVFWTGLALAAQRFTK